MHTITVSDTKGNIHYLELENTTVVSFENKYPHWAWWILWVVLFWPICIILFFRKKKVCRVNSNHKTIIVDEGTGCRIMRELDLMKNS